MITRSEKNKKIRDEIIHEENSKKFKKITKLVGSIILFIAIIIIYGMYIGAKVVVVNEYKVTNKLIPDSLHGIKIVQLSDILYNSLNTKDLNNIKYKINEINPDIIIFTGNIIKNYSLNKHDIEILEDFFKNLNAKIDKYSIMGNYDNDSFNVIMENSNFKILNNKIESLYYKDSTPINIIGFNTNEIKYDNISESNFYNICLFSNPDKINEILEHVNCNLAISSSTLGGEIKIFNIPIFDNHKYNNNYYKINNTDFYISNGLGNTINVRYFNHPSINLYRLTKY